MVELARIVTNQADYVTTNADIAGEELLTYAYVLVLSHSLSIIKTAVKFVFLWMIRLVCWLR